jgi:hypothetical protein
VRKVRGSTPGGSRKVQSWVYFYLLFEWRSLLESGGTSLVHDWVLFMIVSRFMLSSWDDWIVHDSWHFLAKLFVLRRFGQIWLYSVTMALLLGVFFYFYVGEVW